MTPAQQAELLRRAMTLHGYVMDLGSAALVDDLPFASLAVADAAKAVDELNKFVESCK